MAENRLSPTEERLATRLADEVATHMPSQDLEGLHKGPWQKVLFQITADAYGRAPDAEQEHLTLRETQLRKAALETRLMKASSWGKVKEGLYTLRRHLDSRLVDKWALKTLLYLRDLYEKQVPPAENANGPERAHIRSSNALKMMVSLCIDVVF